MKRAITQLRYHCAKCAQWAIGANRCDDKCVNTVLLETEGPCGSVRRCSGDTVTHDTGVQERCHTRNSWRHFRRIIKNLGETGEKSHYTKN